MIKLAVVQQEYGVTVKREDHGDMIGCDNEHCQIQWFHLSCLKLTRTQVPKGKWYCPDCHKSRKGKGKKTSKQN